MDPAKLMCAGSSNRSGGNKRPNGFSTWQSEKRGVFEQAMESAHDLPSTPAHVLHTHVGEVAVSSGKISQ